MMMDQLAGGGVPVRGASRLSNHTDLRYVGAGRPFRAGWGIVTEDDVRKLALQQARRYAGSRAGSTGLTPWATAHGVHKGALSLFMAGKRPPSADLLHALGLEWRIVRRSSARSKAKRDG